MLIGVTCKIPRSCDWVYFGLCERTWVWVLCMPYVCYFWFISILII